MLQIPRTQPFLQQFTTTDRWLNDHGNGLYDIYGKKKSIATKIGAALRNQLLGILHDFIIQDSISMGRN